MLRAEFGSRVAVALGATMGSENASPRSQTPFGNALVFATPLPLDSQAGIGKRLASAIAFPNGVWNEVFFKSGLRRPAARARGGYHCAYAPSPSNSRTCLRPR